MFHQHLNEAAGDDEGGIDELFHWLDAGVVIFKHELPQRE